jgi:hypothetical protein
VLVPGLPVSCSIDPEINLQDSDFLS